MFKFSYKENGEVKEVEFNHNFELIRFVAINRIADEDFVSLTIGDDNVNGIDGLVNYAMTTANRMEDSYNRAMEFMAMMENEGEEDEGEDDDFYFIDDEEEEF